MKMKLMKNKKMQQKFPRKVLVPQSTAEFTSRVSKSYVPFTCISYGNVWIANSGVARLNGICMLKVGSDKRERRRRESA